MSAPLISVITVVFNRAATIRSALQSVCGQHYPLVEHLVIDGASTDGTLDLLRASQREGLRVVSEPDDGIYDAINKGIALARGDVVGLMHSDDLFAHPGVLDRVAAAFESDEVDAVYGDLEYVAADDTDRVIRYWKAGAYTRSALARGWMPPHPTLYVRRAVIDQWGAYDTGYRIAADYDAILRWFAKGHLKVTYIPEVLVRMRVGGASNANARSILHKSREDYRALRRNGVGGLFSLFLKNARKVPQFLVRNP